MLIYSRVGRSSLAPALNWKTLANLQQSSIWITDLFFFSSAVKQEMRNKNVIGTNQILRSYFGKNKKKMFWHRMFLFGTNKTIKVFERKAKEIKHLLHKLRCGDFMPFLHRFRDQISHPSYDRLNYLLSYMPHVPAEHPALQPGRTTLGWAFSLFPVDILTFH